jgi:hypothetical protein
VGAPPRAGRHHQRFLHSSVSHGEHQPTPTLVTNCISCIGPLPREHLKPLTVNLWKTPRLILQVHLTSFRVILLTCSIDGCVCVCMCMCVCVCVCACVRVCVNVRV